MKKYEIEALFEQTVYFEVEANSKKEALKKLEENEDKYEVDWVREAKLSDWKITGVEKI